MRHFIRFLLLTSFCSVWQTSLAAEPPHLVVNLVASEYPPTTSALIPGGGILDHKVKEAFELMGYEVKVTYLPFARAYTMAKSGKFDGIYDLWMTPERGKYFMASQPLYQSHFNIYAKAEQSHPAKSLDELQGQSIGIVSGYAYPEALLNRHLDLDYSSDDMSNFRKVLMGRNQYVVTTKDRMDWLMRTDLRMYQGVFYKTNIHLQPLQSVVGFPNQLPRSKVLKDAFNKGLQLLEKTKSVKAQSKAPAA